MNNRIRGEKRNFILLCLVLLLLLAVPFFMSACEPSITIRVQNQTDKALEIFNDDVLIGIAVPGGEVKYELAVIFSHYVVIARDMDGNLVYSKVFTREDMVRNKWRVVIPPTAKNIEQSDNATGNSVFRGGQFCLLSS